MTATALVGMGEDEWELWHTVTASEKLKYFGLMVRAWENSDCRVEFTGIRYELGGGNM